MSLIVKSITRAPEKDAYGNWSYFATFEGIDGGVLVRHKGDVPVLKPGDDATAAGWDRVDDLPKKSGDGTYKKLMRPEKQNFNGGGGGRANPEDMRQRAAQGALSNAVATVPSGTNSADILKVAERYYAWLRAKAEGQ